MVFSVVAASLVLATQMGENSTVSSPVPLAAEAETSSPSIPATGGQKFSFEHAEQRLRTNSPTSRAADLGRQSAASQRSATDGLNRPLVSLSAQWIRYRKTFDLSLSDALDQAQNNLADALPGLIDGLPNVPADVRDQVAERLEAALPEFFAGLPQDLRLEFERSSFQPTVTAIQPLYTGGAIPALRRAAGANADLAEARWMEAVALEDVNLAKAYFGQVLAAEAVAIARDTLDGFDLHLKNATRMYEEGFLAQAQVLQVAVARDAAQRQVNRTEVELANAQAGLSYLLDLDVPVDPTTPLFVNRTSVGPADLFLHQADQSNAKLAQAQAGRELAAAGADLAASRLRPQVYAFGTYNFNPGDALPTDPDWAIGIGARYTLISPLDRRQMLSAARTRAQAANEVEREARQQIKLLVTRAWNQTELARRQFLTMESSLAAAQENLRVQEIGFREGEATATSVIDARNLLGNARLQRAAAAYEYNLSLAALLAATGGQQSLSDYWQRPDRISTP